MLDVVATTRWGCCPLEGSVLKTCLAIDCKVRVGGSCIGHFDDRQGCKSRIEFKTNVPSRWKLIQISRNRLCYWKLRHIVRRTVRVYLELRSDYDNINFHHQNPWSSNSSTMTIFCCWVKCLQFCIPSASVCPTTPDNVVSRSELVWCAKGCKRQEGVCKTMVYLSDRLPVVLLVVKLHRHWLVSYCTVAVRVHQINILISLPSSWSSFNTSTSSTQIDLFRDIETTLLGYAPFTLPEKKTNHKPRKHLRVLPSSNTSCTSPSSTGHCIEIFLANSSHFQ